MNSKIRDDGAVISAVETKSPPKRSAVGRLWVTLLVRRNMAERESNTDRMGLLADMLNDLEEEFPKDVQAERDYWQQFARE